MSMTADQWLRFWDIGDLTSDKILAFKFHCKHLPEDSLSACAITKDCNYLLTADTSGHLKKWDIS